MPAPLLIDVSHTSHTRARTGIQRVTRSVCIALADRAVPITHDPHRNIWRTLERWELKNLSAEHASASRGARWPLLAKLRGRAQRLARNSKQALPANSGLIVPEVFSPTTGRSLPDVFTATPGPHIAIFHDAIALK